MSETLQKIDIREGEGKEAVAGKPVVVHYTGWLHDPAAEDGKGEKFDSSHDRNGDGLRRPWRGRRDSAPCHAGVRGGTAGRAGL